MPSGVSALPQTSSTTKKEMEFAGWDPQMSVPVVELLTYTEDGGTAVLNRMVQPNMTGTSAGTGLISVAAFGYSGTSYRKIPVGTDDLLRVYTVSGTAGTVTLSADASGNRVSAIQGDAGLLHVSAIGGTSSPLSADSSSVSAKQGDAANLRVSSLQSGTWSLTALLSESTAFVGQVSANQGDANKFHTSAVQGDAGLLHTSAYVGDGNQFHVSAVQGDAGLLHVSAVGGTAGDNTLVDGTTQSISATVQRVSGVVSSGANALATYPQNRDDAVNLRVSGLSKDAGTFLVSARLTDKYVSAFLDNGSVSAKSSDAGTFLVSAKSGDAGQLLVSARLTDKYVSSFIDNGSVSAKSSDAGTMLVSAKQGDAGLLHVSAFNGDAGTFLVSARLTDKYVSATIDNGSISAKSSDAGTFHVSGYNADGNQFHVSAVQGDAGLLRVSSLGGTFSLSADASGNRVSALSPDAGTFLVSAKSGDGNQFHVSAVQGDAGLQLVSSKSGDGNQFHVSAVQSDAGLQLVSSKSGDGNQFHVSAVQGDAGLQRTSSSLFPDTTGALSIFTNYNLSTSINVKATAGSPYGWYAWNTDTKPAYINFYNVTGAINVGTDAIKLQIALPASAAANVFAPMGLVGFTNGISLVALSAVISTATNPPAASSVGINLFYK